MRFSRVDLPQPLCPSSRVISPRQGQIKVVKQRQPFAAVIEALAEIAQGQHGITG